MTDDLQTREQGLRAATPDELRGMLATIAEARSDECTGPVCVHGTRAKFCPMRGCYPDAEELSDNVLAQVPHLLTRISALEEALRPFADADKAFEDNAKRLGCRDGNAAKLIPRAYLRLARATLDGAGEKG